MNKLLDFDNFLAEKKRQYVDVKVFGKVYKVQKEIPAMLVIEMARAAERKKNDAAENGKMTLKMGEAMFGRAALDEICGKGISSTDLAQLIDRTFAMITGKDVDGEDINAETVDDESGMVTPKEQKRKK